MPMASSSPAASASRGRGKDQTIRFAREREIPFLGICLGLQCAVIEFARNVCGLAGANSSEFDPTTPHPVIDLLPEQKDVTDLGGSMRLGAALSVFREPERPRRTASRSSRNAIDIDW